MNCEHAFGKSTEAWWSWCRLCGEPEAESKLARLRAVVDAFLNAPGDQSRMDFEHALIQAGFAIAMNAQPTCQPDQPKHAGGCDCSCHDNLCDCCDWCQ